MWRLVLAENESIKFENSCSHEVKLLLLQKDALHSGSDHFLTSIPWLRTGNIHTSFCHSFLLGRPKHIILPAYIFLEILMFGKSRIKITSSHSTSKDFGSFDALLFCFIIVHVPSALVRIILIYTHIFRRLMSLR